MFLCVQKTVPRMAPRMGMVVCGVGYTVHPAVGIQKFKALKISRRTCACKHCCNALRATTTFALLLGQRIEYFDRDP